MSLLLLGGTADGRRLAKKLHQQGVSLIYSVAGLVRQPDVPCEVISGGFSQFGGLVEYIKQHAIVAILDVTHPYAAKMSATAVDASKTCCIPCWRFHRPAWEKQAGDLWQEFISWETLLPALKDKKTVFLTAGQLEQQAIDALTANEQQRQLLRTAVEPKVTLSDSMHWIKAIGPFNLTDELALMKTHNVDALVSKNSGGESTVAKIQAARALGVPVYMLERPTLPKADEIFTDSASCERFVVSAFNNGLTINGRTGP
ncbi:precorrin-6A reductase [Alkalimarinus alittae]|uniref:Precorrin-6A reductase n=1 Tax=Alkalimarinus alittae TaxID=2961619 RepID=A0ABY6N5S9_9ALTE|nr:precorrin-6A reductase [Alkalimarinus alittae]UZE97483.1 precorrin-6A reductase [Alkalimarinus alittae]